MPIGNVKWFNNAKGYGFILPEEGGEDLFVHYSSIEMEGYKTLKAGQTVEYETVKSTKGFHAVNIRAQEATDDEESTSVEDAAPVADEVPEPSQSEALQRTTGEETDAKEATETAETPTEATEPL